MSLATVEQNQAAGGIERRKLKTRSGEIFTVSLAIRLRKNNTDYSITLRFKTGGTTIQRPVAVVSAQNRFEALMLGWQAVRSKNVIEQFHWSWMHP